MGYGSMGDLHNGFRKSTSLILTKSSAMFLWCRFLFHHFSIACCPAGSFLETNHFEDPRTCGVFHILTSKCASGHNGVHFFGIATPKSGPTLRCFVHFDFEMCFAPQRRALFRHRNFQKWSDAGVFCTFWLGNALRATTACTFSTSQLPKAVRRWGVLYMLTSKCASRHNGVQFFISHLASWLRARRFSKPTFRPSGASNDWKNTVFRDFPTFSRICIFFLLTLSLLLFSLLIVLFSLPLPCSAFHLPILSEVWLLNFLRLVANENEAYSHRFCGQTPSPQMSILWSGARPCHARHGSDGLAAWGGRTQTKAQQ